VSPDNEGNTRLLRCLSDGTSLWDDPKGTEKLGEIDKDFLCVPIAMRRVGQWTWFKVLTEVGVGWVLERWLDTGG
jgi:hypothetical protein